ncbi:hypothetical protein HYDPIDRAFT_110995 [Hydnomerulius pinastri MD-312]|uniref:Secreted protein n=1 Tax=Hydnomerulius pinastri MD-312 TaxID=994086 RepID=A0A0C9WAR4_9AGAM|nr:hypothetical protein HYDPIDRAFT_110995 [Hydnomerulius pinastri MD-312]
MSALIILVFVLIGWLNCACHAGVALPLCFRGFLNLKQRPPSGSSTCWKFVLVGVVCEPHSDAMMGSYLMRMFGYA